MDLGYDGKLFILAFDHRGSFKKKMFGISGREATPTEQEQLEASKSLVWEGFQAALEAGAPAAAAGVLVDEEMGTAVARAAKEAGVLLAVPVEKSGQDIFDFEYGEDFGAHIEAFDPAFAKVLVRWNPADDPEIKQLQAGRLQRLGDWLHARERKYLFELLVPATPRQLALIGGSAADYDAHVRPYLMLETIYEIQEAGIEPDVWKIEGIDTPEDCALISALARRDGRDGVKAVVLGRGADDAKVEHWVRTGAGVPGYVGFAIGRTIWWDAVTAWKDGTLTRAQAAAAIGAAYRKFIDVYERAGR
ncbi:MAG: DUF2090 domain-containing protein [Actinomycetota bacterium]